MNTKYPLMDPSGRQLFAVGGPRAWKTHDCGGYQVSLEWIDGEPGMVIWSTLNPRFAYAICLSSIGKYATPEGKPNPEGLDELAKALPDFGREISRLELHRLLDIVLRYAPELILMPPAPMDILRADAKAPIWEVTEIEKGRKVSEACV